MDNKQMYVQVINLETGKIFSLPTLYTDRTEACVCGQNYVRDRQAEEPGSMLFFRVLFVDSMWDNEDDCNGECHRCGLCYEDEEPEHGESVYGDAEEPSSETLAELLSVFNAVRQKH